MQKIMTFADLEKALDNSDYDWEEISLSKSEQQYLFTEIKNFDTDVMKNADDVLSDYYSIQVPHEMIKEVLAKDIKLAFEIYTNGVRDTCQRSVFIDSILSHIGMRSWPTNGEGTKIMMNFSIELKQKAEQVGIQIII